MQQCTKYHIMCASKYRNTQSYIRNAAVYIIPYNVSLKIQKYTELHLKCSDVKGHQWLNS